MPEKLPQTIQTADPSKFSLREEALSLKRRWKKEKRFKIDGLPWGEQERRVSLYIDKKTKERFYRIDRANPEHQRLVYLLMKGVINVSDVVKVDGNFFSHEQDFNNIKPSGENIEAEVGADIFLIREIFLDSDRTYYPHGNQARSKFESRHPAMPLEHTNLRVDEPAGRSSFFDFHNSGFSSQIFPINPENFRRKAGDILKWISGSHSERTEILEIVRKKLKLLLELYPADGFGVFQKIVKRSGVKLTEGDQKILFNNFRQRLTVFYELLPGSNTINS